MHSILHKARPKPWSSDRVIVPPKKIAAVNLAVSSQLTGLSIAFIVADGGRKAVNVLPFVVGTIYPFNGRTTGTS